MDDKIDEMSLMIETCLAESQVPVQGLANFCQTLKAACESYRANGKNKKDEQDFCEHVISKIIYSTEKKTSEILTDNKNSSEEKGIRLTHLTYLSMTLIALTKVQHRFGGRLGYHCLVHSQGVVQYPDFLIICAAANHDVVMRYANSPDFEHPEIIKLEQAYHHARNKLAKGKKHVDETPQLMYLHKKRDIKTLKTVTEQKRLAGWVEGSSERDSFHQMEIQLTQLIHLMEARDHESKYQKEFEHLKREVDATRTYRAMLIRGTIPTKGDFALPGLGDKLNTIGNVNVFPSVWELANAAYPLRLRFIQLIDHVIGQILGPKAMTFQQAVDDIHDARLFYQRVIVATEANPSTSQEEIKKKIRQEMRQEKSPSLSTKDKYPHYETVNERVLFSMPPFDDPMKQFKDIPQDSLIHQLSEGLIHDAHEHGDGLLVEHLMRHVSDGIVANFDLGTCMKEEAEWGWLHNEIIGLIVEENPYQAQSFFLINVKLSQEGGLADEKVHIKLREDEYRNQWGISEDEYRQALEFMDIAYYFINENLFFTQGAIQRFQFYIYQPMKALQMAFEEPFLHGMLKFDEKSKLNKIVVEFEKVFCLNGKLRESIVQKIQAYIKECQTAGSLSKHILAAMGRQFGSHFLVAPLEYGYTEGKKIHKEFLAEQDDRKL